MKHWWFLFGALICASPLFSQEPVEIYGYFEPQLMGASIDNEWIQMQSNKLRIDLKASLSDRIEFAGNFNVITYHGQTHWNIPDYLPVQVARQIPAPFREYYQLNFNDRQFLDNAYLKISHDAFDLTVGKQPISPGTGYAWNPTDLYNLKDIMDPTYEQPGHNALRLDVPITHRMTFSALYFPENRWENSGKTVQMKMNIDRFDVHLVAAERLWTVHDYLAFNGDVMNPGLQQLTEKRQMAGICLAGELLGLGVWGEYAYNRMETSDNFYEWVAGADYTFKSGTYLMTEFYVHSLGKTNSEHYFLNDWLQYMASERRSLTRSQVYGFLQHPVTDLIQLGLSGIWAVSDGSVAIIPSLNTTLYDDVELTVFGNLYAGNDLAVFNSKLGNGVLIRARVYF